MDFLIWIKDFLPHLIRAITKRNEYNLQFYSEIKKEAQAVYSDLFNTLKSVQSKIRHNQLSVDESLNFIDCSRIPLKAIRDELKVQFEDICLSYDDIRKRNDLDIDIAMFAIGIRGILCGGLAPSRHFESIELIIDEYLHSPLYYNFPLFLHRRKQPKYFIAWYTARKSPLLFPPIDGHTLLDFLSCFDPASPKYIMNNPNYFGNKHAYYNITDEDIPYMFDECLTAQMEYLENSWKLTVKAYNRIRKKYKKFFHTK